MIPDRRKTEAVSDAAVLVIYVGNVFTTYEKVETIPLTVIKKDNTREQYDRRKVENGVVRACYKRPVATADIQKVCRQNRNKKYLAWKKKEIPSSAIGEAVMDELKTLDEVAYVRFCIRLQRI